MSRDTYRVGIVGCGNIGRTHAEAYRRLDQCELVAGADLNGATLQAFVADFELDAGYERHDEMFAAEDLDLVSVCTLHSSHAGISIDAAEAGIPGIYCEKPMATSLGEAQDMLDAADNNETKLTVGHMRRFNPNHVKARELIADGAIGEPLQVATRARGGLLNNGTHTIDTTLYVLDDPPVEWISGQVERDTDRHERGLPIEDSCSGIVCFEDGLRMSFECDTPGPDSKESRIQITGTEGRIGIELGSDVTLHNEDGTRTFDAERGRMIQQCIDAHLEWQAGSRSENRASGETGYRSMELMMGIYESARTRGVVEPPIETRANPLLVMLDNDELPVQYPGAYDIRLPYASVRMDE